MSKQYGKSALNEKQTKLSTYLVLPIALILLIVPLIVHLRTEPISSVAIPFWNGGNKDSDFFSYYKMVWFLILTGIAIIAFIVKMMKIKFEIKKTWLYAPMGVYALFVIFSSFNSKAREVAFKGFPNRYEGMYVILAYLVIMFIVINIVDNEKQIKIVLGGLSISTLLIGIIGTFQYFNMDLFQTEFGKKLMLPIANWSNAGELSFRLGARAVYATLYHTNYVGGFTAMLFPLTVAILIFSKDKKYIIGSGILSALMFLCLITSHSRAGIAGAIVATLLLLVLFATKALNGNKKADAKTSDKSLVLGLKNFGILLVALIIIYFVVNGVSKTTVSEKIGTLYNDNSPSLTAVAGIKDISVTKALISMSDGTNKLNIDLNKGQMRLTDQNHQKISFEFDNKTNIVTFKQPQYAPYKLTILRYNGQPVIDIVRASFKANFVVTPVGFKLLDNRNTVLDITPIKTWGFKGYESLGSARGYIWSRSLPLLRDTILTGFGPDTFAMHFPQNDYIGKLLAYGDSGIIVDKPHNMYLQAGINTGIISLLALLALFVMYLVFTIKTLFGREFNNIIEITGAGILAAVCGYLIAGLFNDSTISVSPVFWILLGVGVSINLMLKPSSIKK